MHTELLQDLAIIMIVAGVVTVIFRQLRQPVVLGYILAGLIIGPHTPPVPLIHDEHVISTLAEIGVVLLMFSLGLHFSLRHLARVGTTASLGALFEIVLMVAVGYGVGQLFGWSTMDSIFLGALLSISSTTIIIKALEDLGQTKEKFAKITFGILIVEDIAAILILALLSGYAISGGLSLNQFLDTLTQLSIFLAVVLLAGLMMVPRLLRYLSKFQSNEMMLVALLGLCFGVSLLALKMGYSVALGAFLIGAVVAESREGPRAAELVEPVRDMFSAVFFVAVGMMIQPAMLMEYALPIAIITVVVILGKIISCSLGALVGGADPRTSLRVGMSVSQIGEFSFIIASLGEALDVTSGFLYPVAVTVSAITTLTTPYLIRYSDSVANAVRPLVPEFIVQSTRLYERSKPLEQLDRASMAVRKVTRRSLLQIGLNLLLIAGIFFAATALEVQAAAWLPRLPEWTGGPKTVLWAVAVAIALPLCVAVVRKLQALSMILAEASIGERGGNAQQKYALRSLLTSILLVIFTLLFVVALLLMGSALLPPLPVLVGLLLLMSFLLYQLWGHFVRVYSRAQIALRETFEQADQAQAERILPDLLRQSHVRVVELTQDCHGAGRLIRELELRTRTGATIVGMERGGKTSMNPGPHEELQSGDRLLLLGEENQLAAAESVLLAH